MNELPAKVHIIILNVFYRVEGAVNLCERLGDVQHLGSHLCHVCFSTLMMVLHVGNVPRLLWDGSSHSVKFMPVVYL